MTGVIWEEEREKGRRDWGEEKGEVPSPRPPSPFLTPAISPPQLRLPHMLISKSLTQHYWINLSEGGLLKMGNTKEHKKSL